MLKNKKLAIVGASYLQLPLALKAREMGIKTYCFAWDDGAVCKDYVDQFFPISILEKEKILEICREIAIDGICSIASDVAVVAVNYVAHNMNLLANDYDGTLATTDKFAMRKCFHAAGVNIPMFALSSDAATIPTMNFPLIVKPTDRSGSLGVVKVYDSEELEDAVINAQNFSFTKTAIVEEYISGNEVSVESISWEGKHYILAITDKVTTGVPYFVELEHHQPSALPREVCDAIKAETIKALDALNIKYGASHSEFKITKSGKVYAIEVGARMGGDFIGSDLVYLSTGYDFVKAVIGISLGTFEEPEFTNCKYSGVYFLCAETLRLQRIIAGSNTAPEVIRKEIINEELKSVKCSADRSGYLIYQAGRKYII